MSIGPVITRGYGLTGLPSSIANVVLRGYTAAEEIVSDEVPSGGWGFLTEYYAYKQRKRRRERERERILAEIAAIEGDVDFEIAVILQADVVEEAEAQELSWLEQMVAAAFTERDRRQAREYNIRVSKAFVRAAMQGNWSAFEALERELDRAEEEEFFLLVVMLE